MKRQLWFAMLMPVIAVVAGGWMVAWGFATNFLIAAFFGMFVVLVWGGGSVPSAVYAAVYLWSIDYYYRCDYGPVDKMVSKAVLLLQHYPLFAKPIHSILLSWRASTRFHLGDVETAVALSNESVDSTRAIREALQKERRQDWDSQLAIVLRLACMHRLVGGDTTGAEEAARESIDLFSKSAAARTSYALVALPMSVLAISQCLRGETQAALENATKATATAESEVVPSSLGPRATQFQKALCLATEAVALALDGQTEASNRCLENFARRWRDDPLSVDLAAKWVLSLLAKHQKVLSETGRQQLAEILADDTLYRLTASD